MFKLKQKKLVICWSTSNETFVIVDEGSFILKALLFITYATKMIIICLLKFQQDYNIGLDTFLNKVFELKII
jgi:hypothetical protein